MPVLYDDVLLDIMAAAPIEVTARLMAVSRFLYLHGPKYVLSEPPFLKDEQQLLSFLAFLSVQPESRSKFVRHLKLHFIDLSTPTSLRLVNALSLMTNLQSLALSCRPGKPGRRRHGWDSSLIASFAAHPSLHVLHLSNLQGMDSLELLQTLRPRLTRLTVDFPAGARDNIFDDLFGVLEWNDFHPLLWLAPFAPTLAELSVTRWCTHPRDAPTTNIVYPRLRTLAMHDATLPLTLPFVRAFPHLARLAFRTKYYNSHGDPSAQVRLCRDRNVQEQQRAGTTWERLRAFDGGLAGLYVLGLVCGIERVGLESVHQDRLYMLAPVLAHARPRVLELGGWPMDIRRPGLRGDGGARAVLQGAGAARLEDLTIEGRLEGEEHRGVDLFAVLDDLADALAGMRLRQFTLKIYTEHIDATGYDDAVGRPLGTAERTARDLDVGAYLGRFVAAVPTLEAAVLSEQGPRNQYRTRTATFACGGVGVEDRTELPEWLRGRKLDVYLREA